MLPRVVQRMEVMDKVFEATFARWRRKLGDSNMESAWRRASNSISGLILFPTAAIVIPVALFVAAMTHTGYSAEEKRTIQIIGVVIWFSVSFLLDRRFRKFLISPPRLESEESFIDKRLLMKFRVACIASFVVSCVGGWLMHGVGPI
jgi:hypothetical protein